MNIANYFNKRMIQDYMIGRGYSTEMLIENDTRETLRTKYEMVILKD